MNVEDIPADEVISMTDLLHRAFNAGGCNPICHCCLKGLDVGEKFKLATVMTYSKDNVNYGISRHAVQVSREVMLCDKCTIEDMVNMNDERVKKYEEYRENGGGCFRVNGQIIH